MTSANSEKFKFGIPKNVFTLGLVSFFNDIASEMISPILPIFLTTVLGAPVAIVGLIEGIAKATASISKVFSGWLSDKLQKRKPFVVAGYSLSALSKIILSFAYSWPFVLIARFVGRLGKGTRTPARDALIAESSENSIRGRSFGFHRALDTSGAVVGPLIALVAVKFLDGNFRLIFFLASIPAVFAVLLLLFFTKEPRRRVDSSFSIRFSWRKLDHSFKSFLLVSSIFAIGNISNAFLILRAKDLGLSVTLVVLVYVLFNFTYAGFSIPAGIISDKIGSKRVLLTGFFLFAFVFLLFGLVKKSCFLWFLFPIYGICMALTEGVGKAYISNLVPQELVGTAFGVYQTIVGFCAFFASFFAGLLWSYVSISAPFFFGAILAVISALLFIVLEKRIECAKI